MYAMYAHIYDSEVPKKKRLNEILSEFSPNH